MDGVHVAIGFGRQYVAQRRLEKQMLQPPLPEGNPRIEGTISDIFWCMVLVKATVNGRKYVVKHVDIKGLKINDKVTFEVLPLSYPEDGINISRK